MKSVLVTGSNGGIGQALCSYLSKKGYKVIGTDQQSSGSMEKYICCDLGELLIDEDKMSAFKNKVLKLSGGSLDCLVNNAAIQILAPAQNLSLQDFQKSLDINLKVPFILSKAFFSELEQEQGSIINIGSIHSQLTKPEFVAYATSKSAIEGMTKAMAVDFGGAVRVNAICPAAVDTDMLRAGFEKNPKGLEELKQFHPSKSIAAPEEVAQAVAYLENAGPFTTGTVLTLNGGIGSRLHDPV